MSEGGAPSKYVKLTKEQAPVDEVNPGELNQPIQVPHVCLSLYWSDFLKFSEDCHLITVI